MRGSKRGFTLIELLVVIAIIAILAAILLPVFARMQAKAEQTSCASNLKQIGTAFMMYTQDYDEVFPWFNTDQAPIVYLDAPNNVLRANAMELVQPYVKSRAAYACQGHRIASSVNPDGGPYLYQKTSWRQNPYSYLQNGELMRTRQSGVNGGIPVALADVRNPAELLMVGETPVNDSDSNVRWSNSDPGLFRNNCTASDRGQWGSGFVHFDGENVCYADGHVKWVKFEFVCSEGAKPKPTSRFWSFDAP